MVSVSERFQELRRAGQCGLIPFLTAGDPDLTTTARALRVLDESGADLIELGVPYADPLADGPVIQAAATRALQRGVRFGDVLAMVSEVAPTLRSPLILFSYYNPMLYQGIEVFLDRIAAAGVRGLVVPDLPLEEAQEAIEAAATRGIEVVLLVAPTSDRDRMERIAHQSRGFVYLVSVTGVTGIRSQMQQRVSDLIQQLKSVTDKPVGVGFGISQPEQAAQVKAWGADAAIVGSAFVKRLAAGEPEAGLVAIREFCQSLKAALA